MLVTSNAAGGLDKRVPFADQAAVRNPMMDFRAYWRTTERLHEAKCGAVHTKPGDLVGVRDDSPHGVGDDGGLVFDLGLTHSCGLPVRISPPFIALMVTAMLSAASIVAGVLSPVRKAITFP